MLMANSKMECTPKRLLDLFMEHKLLIGPSPCCRDRAKDRQVISVSRQAPSLDDVKVVALSVCVVFKDKGRAVELCLNRADDLCLISIFLLNAFDG